MQSTQVTRRRVSRGTKPWLRCTFLYLLASAPLAHAADAVIEQKAQACAACHRPEELRAFQVGSRRR